MHGQPARRSVRHFGARYGYESWGLTGADPLPVPLLALRERCAELAGLAPDAGVSLGSPRVMRFQRRVAGERRVHEQELAPASAYLLSGAARWTWQHSIPAVPAERFSVTFGTLRSGAAGRRPEPAGEGGEALGDRDGGEVGVPAADDLDADR